MSSLHPSPLPYLPKEVWKREDQLNEGCELLVVGGESPSSSSCSPSPDWEVIRGDKEERRDWRADKVERDMEEVRLLVLFIGSKMLQ